MSIQTAKVDRCQDTLTNSIKLLDHYKALCIKHGGNFYVHHIQVVAGMVDRSQQHLNDAIAEAIMADTAARIRDPEPECWALEQMGQRGANPLDTRPLVGR